MTGNTEHAVAELQVLSGVAAAAWALVALVECHLGVVDMVGFAADELSAAAFAHDDIQEGDTTPRAVSPTIAFPHLAVLRMAHAFHCRTAKMDRKPSYIVLRPWLQRWLAG